MKRLFVILFVLLTATRICVAVPIDTLFAGMPDRLLPLLNLDNRLDCLDLYNGKMNAEVTNLFGERSRLTVKTADYLRVELSAASRMELKLLSMGNDTVIGRIHTVLTPAADSRVEFFTTAWKPCGTVHVVPPKENDFWVRPDTVTEARFEELRRAAGLAWVEAVFSSTGDTLTYSLSLDNVRSDWREEMRSCVRPVTYRWDGAKFVH